MTAIEYLPRMAVIGGKMQMEIKAVLRAASEDPDISPLDFEAIVFSARSVFFPTKEELRGR